MARDILAQGSRRVLVWGLAFAGLCLVGSSLALAAVGLPAPVYPGLAALLVIPTPLLLLGALICTRKPQERMGPMLLALGLVGSLQLAAGEYATYSVRGRSGQLFATGAAGWLSSVAQVFTVVGLVVIILFFPTGHLLSHRWRPVAWVVAGAGVLGAINIALGGPRFNSNLDFVRNPWYVAHPPGILVALKFIAQPLLGLGLIGAIGQLVVRLRRSRGEEREQLKLFAYAGIMAPLITLVLSNGPLGNVAWTLGPFSLIAAVGFAIFRYRLYEIDVVINRTVVFGSLAAFITAVYVAIVVGIGTVVGHGSKPNLGLSILATAVVGVAFQPVRERVQRFANRLVYGHRATPYEVLSEFSSHMAGGYESDDLLPRMARILGEGTGARSARVWLKVGDELRSAAAWPGLEEREVVAMKNGELPAMPDASLVLPVVHRGNLLGALSLNKPSGERVTPAEEKLAGDLASGAGLVLRNVRLTEELLARLEELRASRQRLVTAQDAERRRLERNIHDGAQQQLVALAIKIRLARKLNERDHAQANELLEQTEGEVTGALEDLRDLARGIYPPLLAEQGLVIALEAQGRRSAVAVEIQADGVGRYSQATEAAVYFCCLEALQNVSKYAKASSARIRLAARDEELTFTVSDDGLGFETGAGRYGTGLQGMADRLAALGGDMHIDSKPGAGTTVTGRLPIGTSVG